MLARDMTDLSSLATQVLELLTSDEWVQEAPWTRDELTDWTGKSDRENRDAIAELRDAGHPIIAHPQGGYYYSDRPEDIRKLYDQCRARLVAHARTMRAFRGRVPLLPDEGQEVLALLGESATDEGGEEA